MLWLLDSDRDAKHAITPLAHIGATSLGMAASRTRIYYVEDISRTLIQTVAKMLRRSRIAWTVTEGMRLAQRPILPSKCVNPWLTEPRLRLSLGPKWQKTFAH